VALVRAVSLYDVAAALVAYGTMAAGAAYGHVLLLDEGGNVGVSLLGGPGVQSRHLPDLGRDAAVPWNDALRDDRRLFFPSSDAFHHAYPALNELSLPAGGPVMTVPLITVGERRGAISFGFDAGAAIEDALAGAPLDAIAVLAGQAAARAAVYASEHQSAELLQRAYLPTGVSPLAGLSFATRYLPAGEPVAVGGDWYDVIPLPGSQVGIIIGDVAGHGLKAATVMASLRAGLRAFALVHGGPALILGRLNEFTCLFKPDAFATVFVAVFDPADGRIRYASAGHPPALLVTPGSPTRLLDDAVGPPLGLPGAVYSAGEQPFPVGASLVAYTDGLIERRGEPIDARLSDLVAVAPAAAELAPEGLCDRLVFEVLAGEELADDAALLVATRRAGS
jgi:hypothetical protein